VLAAAAPVAAAFGPVMVMSRLLGGRLSGR
jgi:hypothetical protein